ncbi:hypothetical protein ACS0TY_013734 [Phlomoides rotata]
MWDEHTHTSSILVTIPTNISQFVLEFGVVYCIDPFFQRLTNNKRELVLLQLQCCVCIASDGGRVCCPLVIADKGVLRIKEHYMKELRVTSLDTQYVSHFYFDHPAERFVCFKDGVRTFQSFLKPERGPDIIS